jgi:uncharacterized membrane protein SirB2
VGAAETEVTLPPERLEKDKAILEYLRHTATLASGTLVILSGFLEKVFTTAAARAWGRAALIAFLTSLLINIIAYVWSLSFFFGSAKPRRGLRARLFVVLAALSALAMFVGFATVAAGGVGISAPKGPGLRR